MNVRELVVERAGGRCEALIEVRFVWTRCFTSPIEVHHMFFRSRGGEILDRVGETYHLAALCAHHHRVAHREQAGGEFIISGYVTTGANNQPVYVGSDEYLLAKYGSPDVFEQEGAVLL